MQKALLMAALFLTAALAGCASSDKADEPPTAPAPQGPGPAPTTDVTQRADLPFNTTAQWSQTLEPGPHGIQAPRSVFVDLELPVTEGGAAVNPASDPVIHLGLFLPDVPGCDLDAGDVLADCKVPVIADAGPYYATPNQVNPSPLTEGDVPADQRGSVRLGEFLISNFVPHGYAVAQISVTGSGASTHCFDMFGNAEQLGVLAAVEWLGTQGWSNGNVSLIGRSYDGSTPWMAAALGSEHLKTIVPISGLTGLQDLVQWNGASESRIATFQNVIYGQYGLDGDAQDLDTVLCPDWLTATPWGASGYLGGADAVDVEGTYWQERTFSERVIQNYRGSVYLIHGLQDDNVDPHAGWVLHEKLIDGGWETKGLYGQWYHSYPDRPSEHGGENQHPRNSVRYDWAQDLLEWFDHYLKGTGAKPALVIEVQEHSGAWRIDDGLSPSNARIEEVPLTGTGSVSITGGLDLDLGPISDDDVVLGGLSSVNLSVTPQGPGGQIYVELYDATDNSEFGLAYGIMELRHATGAFAPVVPGQSMDIVIPIQYFSDILPGGHHLGMRIAESGNGYLPSPVVTPTAINDGHLALSIVEPGPGAYFEPPTWPGL